MLNTLCFPSPQLVPHSRRGTSFFFLLLLFSFPVSAVDKAAGRPPALIAAPAAPARPPGPPAGGGGEASMAPRRAPPRGKAPRGPTGPAWGGHLCARSGRPPGVRRAEELGGWRKSPGHGRGFARGGFVPPPHPPAAPDRRPTPAAVWLLPRAGLPARAGRARGVASSRAPGGPHGGGARARPGPPAPAPPPSLKTFFVPGGRCSRPRDRRSIAREKPRDSPSLLLTVGVHHVLHDVVHHVPYMTVTAIDG